jgi:hypothetical protein
MVARRHGIAPSLLYGWRAARKAKMDVAPPEPMEFMPLGVFGRAEDEGPAKTVSPGHSSSIIDGSIGRFRGPVRDDLAVISFELVNLLPHRA